MVVASSNSLLQRGHVMHDTRASLLTLTNWFVDVFAISSIPTALSEGYHACMRRVLAGEPASPTPPTWVRLKQHFHYAKTLGNEKDSKDAKKAVIFFMVPWHVWEEKKWILEVISEDGVGFSARNDVGFVGLGQGSRWINLQDVRGLEFGDWFDERAPAELLFSTFPFFVDTDTSSSKNVKSSH